MKIRGVLNRAVVLLLTAFIVFSVRGAFMGAQRAQVFFNSAPLVLFWGALFLSLLAGFWVYVSLRKRFSLRLIHAGCLLVLAGGMFGSDNMNRLYQRITGQSFFTKGQMVLRQGQSSGQVGSETGNPVGQLPFEVRLDDASVEYYSASRHVKHYKSTLQIIEDGKVKKQATLEVNKPLFYGGYHFYQNTFAATPSGPVSGILVVTARGVWMVFAGYAAIFVGLMMHLWPKAFFKKGLGCGAGRNFDGN